MDGKNFSQNEKILVAMSGGVDSSVAAALLKEAGADLVGVTLILYCSEKSSERSCCSWSAAADAKKVADQLGFPHYTINLKAEFQEKVIADFVNEYRQGRTPNPCIRCNQFIKFDQLLKKAKELGCQKIAMGHYARVSFSPHPDSCSPRVVDNVPLPQGEGVGKLPFGKEKLGEGYYHLLKGKDKKKDQSYVLYRLNQEQLGQIVFPLGEMTKGEVRQYAKKLKLPVAEKKESQEICFVEDDDYGNFLKERAPELVKPGVIVDLKGQVVGQHQGVAFYTIGQRKGIGHHRGEPKYVVAIDQPKNRIVIGDQEDLFKKELLADNLSFIAGVIPTTPLKVTAKIRYNSAEAEATLLVNPKGKEKAEEKAKVKVIFAEPQRAVTPGQAVVFYQGEEVIGGGIIS